jgi:hypothetical protein
MRAVTVAVTHLPLSRTLSCHACQCGSICVADDVCYCYTSAEDTCKKCQAGSRNTDNGTSA